VPRSQGCCGALALHVGAEAQARALARVNLDAFPADVDAIVTTAAGCGSGLRDYAQLFEGTPDAARAKAFAARVMDITVLLDRVGLPPLSPLPPLPSTETKQGTPVTVAYHDACHLAHAQGVRAEPRALLRRIPHLTLVEPAEAGICCGSAGTYNVDQPEIANALGVRKAAALRATIIVSGNIGCLTQIRTSLAANHAADATDAANATDAAPQPEVLHTIELIDRAMTSTAAR
jgi:glycolate oxidase iron-sulfur subunit